MCLGSLEGSTFFFDLGFKILGFASAMVDDFALEGV